MYYIERVIFQLIIDLFGNVRAKLLTGNELGKCVKFLSHVYRLNYFDYKSLVFKMQKMAVFNEKN